MFFKISNVVGFKIKRVRNTLSDFFFRCFILNLWFKNILETDYKRIRQINNLFLRSSLFWSLSPVSSLIVLFQNFSLSFQNLSRIKRFSFIIWRIFWSQKGFLISWLCCYIGWDLSASSLVEICTSGGVAFCSGRLYERFRVLAWSFFYFGRVLDKFWNVKRSDASELTHFLRDEGSLDWGLRVV